MFLLRLIFAWLASRVDSPGATSPAQPGSASRRLTQAWAVGRMVANWTRYHEHRR